MRTLVLLALVLASSAADLDTERRALKSSIYKISTHDGQPLDIALVIRQARFKQVDADRIEADALCRKLFESMEEYRKKIALAENTTVAKVTEEISGSANGNRGGTVRGSDGTTYTYEEAAKAVAQERKTKTTVTEVHADNARAELKAINIRYMSVAKAHNAMSGELKKLGGQLRVINESIEQKAKYEKRLAEIEAQLSPKESPASPSPSSP